MLKMIGPTNIAVFLRRMGRGFFFASHGFYEKEVLTEEPAQCIYNNNSCSSAVLLEMEINSRIAHHIWMTPKISLLLNA